MSDADLRLSKPGRLPKARYLSTRFARLEDELLWPNVWLIAAHASALQQAGNIRVFDHGALSALLICGDDGRIRAFANACRHRGARLCDEAMHARQVTCSVHGWRYRLDGAVAHIPARDGLANGADDLDLRPLRCETMCGFVWLAWSQRAPSLVDFLGPLLPMLEAAQIDDWSPTSDTTIRIAANWKISADMHNEAYHLQHLHPELRGIFSPESVHMTPVGRHHRIDFVLQPPDEPPISVVQYAIFPSAQLTIHPGRAMLLRHRPGNDAQGNDAQTNSAQTNNAQANSAQTCFFDEMTLSDSPDAPPTVHNHEMDPQDAELGSMAAADLRAVQLLARGLPSAADELVLHRLEAPIEHFHAQLDRYLFASPEQK